MQMPSPLAAQRERMKRLLPPTAHPSTAVAQAEDVFRRCDPNASDSMAFVSKVCDPGPRSQKPNRAPQTRSAWNLCQPFGLARIRSHLKQWLARANPQSLVLGVWCSSESLIHTQVLNSHSSPSHPLPSLKLTQAPRPGPYHTREAFTPLWQKTPRPSLTPSLVRQHKRGLIYKTLSG
jgi:hypothetical protein